MDVIVVLINDSTKVRQSNKFGFSCSLVVFKGNRNGSYEEALLRTTVESPEGSLLFYDRALNSLSLGLREGGISQIKVTKKG